MKWGRRETVIFPPHQPIFSIGALIAAVLATCWLVNYQLTSALPPLAHAYLPQYLKSSIERASNLATGSFRLICITDGQRVRVAGPNDVVDGKTMQANGHILPLALSESAMGMGYKAVIRGPEGKYKPGPLHTYLRLSVYEGKGLVETFKRPLFIGAGILLSFLSGAIYFDVKRFKRMKYGRLLKGPIVCDPGKFNKEIKGDGIGFETTDRGQIIRIPQKAEAKHFEIIADTGAGKTALIFQILMQIQARDEGAIIYDPACEFTERFYDPNRGDIILNPLDCRCAYWGPSEELRRRAEAKTLAASLFQSTQDKKGEFFVESPQKIFAHLLTFGPSPAELAEWMANPSEIDKRVKGTEYALLIDPKAPQQRTGVLSSLGLVAESLRMLPTKDETEQRWCATDWEKQRKGWIFITSDSTVREALRPLQSLWLDWLILRLLHKPAPEQKPVWFIIDELASLQKLPQLHTALTENRKSKNPIVLGLQGKAQLEVIYGHLAEVLLSMPATKIFLKSEEEKAALWVSKTLGDTEIERIKYAQHSGKLAGKNYTLDRQVDPAIMFSEIQGLPDLHAFLKYSNHIARFSFAYPVIPITEVGLEPRPLRDDELNFDPFKEMHASAPESTEPETLTERDHSPQKRPQKPASRPPKLTKDEKPGPAQLTLIQGGTDPDSEAEEATASPVTLNDEMLLD